MDFQVSIIGIILILAFYLPGYFFRKFYYSSFSTKQLAIGEWYDRFFKSIFDGMLLQFLIAKILRDNFHFNYNTVSAPLTQLYKKIADNKLPDLDYPNLRNAIGYLVLSIAFACVFGYVTRQFIRIAKIDLRFSPFRFANIWHYYFRGEIVKTSDFQSLRKKGRWVSTRADILVDFVKDEKNILYSGIISQYDLTPKSDKLARIYLTGATRYSSKLGAEGFKPIPGDILILESERILNINLLYDFIITDKKDIGRIFSQSKKIIVLLIFFSPVVVIPYFFYSYLGSIRIVLGIFESMSIFVMILSLVSIIETSKETFSQKYPKSTKSLTIITTIVIVIFLLVIFYFTLN